jgi:hypothetical protein
VRHNTAASRVRCRLDCRQTSRQFQEHHSGIVIRLVNATMSVNSMLIPEPDEYLRLVRCGEGSQRQCFQPVAERSGATSAAA